MGLIALLLMLPLGISILKNLLKRQRAVLDLLCEMIEFLSFAEEKIRWEMKPMLDIANGSSFSDELRALVFEPKTVYESKIANFLSNNDKEELISALLNSGKCGYLNSAEKLSSVRTRLLEISASEEKRIEKEEKIYPILAVSLAAAIFILVI